MVSDGILIQILGLAKAKIAMVLAKREFESPKSLMDKATIILEQSSAKTFKMGGRPTWIPSERAKVQSGQTLMDTGRLRMSVTASSSPHAIRERKGNQLVFGTNIIYAPSHQFGYSERGIPKRPFLAIYDEDRKKLEEVFKDDLDKRFKVVTALG